ncbi:soma ferritin-like [Paramacrobiotus metropolitanus]|uniref:soma ferritin-like n=1 Tax=Paramacrobiotus metropolitanus TaxID=2943436 RepID=UPI002445A46F|nr:soma ferritin-like [Paramacrobiotus metropolitanus]
MSLLARQNFHTEVEGSLNRLINHCLNNSNTYLAMFSYFSQDDVALMKCSKWFKACSDKTRLYALRLIAVQNLRGGRLVLKDIKGPELDSWPSTVNAMQHLLRMEKELQALFLDSHGIAERHGDSEFSHEIASVYLKELEESVKTIADHLANLRRVGFGLGEYQFDRNLES